MRISPEEHEVDVEVRGQVLAPPNMLFAKVDGRLALARVRHRDGESCRRRALLLRLLGTHYSYHLCGIVPKVTPATLNACLFSGMGGIHPPEGYLHIFLSR